MNLVLYSQIPLADQLQIAESIFSQIPNREVRDRNNHHKPLDGHAGRIVILKNEAEPQMTILWQSPALPQMSRQKPELLIEYLLGHIGIGSLEYYLKGRGLATSIAVGTETFQEYCLHALLIMMTSEGAKKTSEIVSDVYRYIIEMRNMSPTQYSSYWMEHSKILNINFNFNIKKDSTETVR